MSVSINATANAAEFVKSVEKGVKLANKNLQKSANQLKLTLNDKGFRQPLGRITGDLNMFDSALAASNARVIAFGASTAVIGGVSKAFKDLAKTTVEVGKQFADINRILQLSNKNFEDFGNRLFDISKKNATAFQDTTKAALEFARQGLKTEETLKRTSDALTLVRLTGINADKAVSSLTATVNAFDNAMITTTSSVNKFVAVETKFAVGARDLVEAIGRVGSSAKDAKVGFDELNAIVTSVQQTTGRGGAVIGNAMKTIFTRLQRQSTLDALESFNVAVKDVQGNTLPAIQILDNFAKSYATLADNSQAYLREQVAGVFQANILSAILKDLNREQSTFSQALKVSASATNEADQATAQLNRSLSALAAQTATEFKRLQENIGKQTFEPIAKAILDPLKSVLSEINNVIDGEGVGSEVANGILKGIKNVIGGPGLVAIGGILLTIFTNTIGYLAKSLPALAGITTETQKRANLEKTIEAVMKSEASIATAIDGYTGDIAAQTKVIADYASIAAAQMENQEESVKQIAATLRSMPTALTNLGAISGQKVGQPKRGASGFIPGVAGEVHDIRRGVGGVSPSAKPVAIPNFAFGGGRRGTMIANTGEYIVPNYSNGGSAIFNPNMVAQYGMPSGAKPIRGASGYVPNFVDTNRAVSVLQSITGKRVDSSGFYSGTSITPSMADDAARDLGVSASLRPSAPKGSAQLSLNAYDRNKATLDKKATNTFTSTSAAMLLPPIGNTGGFYQHNFKNLLGKGPTSVRFPAYTYAKKPKGQADELFDIKTGIENAIYGETVKYAKSITPPAGNITKSEVIGNLNAAQGGRGAVSAAAGAAFEVGVSTALGIRAAAPNKGKNLDVPYGMMSPEVKDLFDQPSEMAKGITGGDFKISSSKDNVKSMAEKIVALDKAFISWNSSRPRASKGYVPNFAALGDAVEREVAAGAPLGSIRINQSSRLVGPQNPRGFAVTNTRDEPAGLADVFTGARGFIPNYKKGQTLDATKVAGNEMAVMLRSITQGLTFTDKALDRFYQSMNANIANLNKGVTSQADFTKKVMAAGRKLGIAEKDLSKLAVSAGQAAVSMKMVSSGGGPGGPGGPVVPGGAAPKGRLASLNDRLSKGPMGGMGIGLGLAMGAPMLGGAVEQMAGEGSKGGQVASGALTGIGTGASLGMMAGPVGALIGAAVGGLGGLAVAAADAGRSLEQLEREAQEYDKVTTDSTNAAREYIKAQEDIASALTESELEDAQKRLAKNFDLIKGTKLEESFAAAGSDVTALTKALAAYEDQRAGGGALKQGLAAARRFDTIDMGKMFGMSGGAVDRYFDAITTMIPGSGDFMGPGGGPAFHTDYKISKEGIENLNKDYGKFFSLLKDSLSDEQMKELSQELKSQTNNFLGFGENEVADLLMSFGGPFEEMAREDIADFFQHLEDATDGKLFSDYLFGDVIDIALNSGKKAREANRETVRRAAQALESFTDIRNSMIRVSESLGQLAGFSKNLQTLRGAYSSAQSGLLSGAGRTLGAVALRRDQFDSGLTDRQTAFRSTFTAKNVTSLLDNIKSGGAAIGDDALARLRETANNFLTGDVEQALEAFKTFTTANKEANQKIQSQIKQLQTEYANQQASFQVEKQINSAKFELEKLREQNTLKEKALTNVQSEALDKRKALFMQEKSRANIANMRDQALLDDPTTFRGMGTQATRNSASRSIRAGMIARNIEMERRAQTESAVSKVAELQMQDLQIKNNLALLSSQDNLRQAIDDLADEMIKASHIAQEQLRKETEIASIDAQIKHQQNIFDQQTTGRGKHIVNTEIKRLEAEKATVSSKSAETIKSIRAGSSLRPDGSLVGSQSAPVSIPIPAGMTADQYYASQKEMREATAKILLDVKDQKDVEEQINKLKEGRTQQEIDTINQTQRLIEQGYTQAELSATELKTQEEINEQIKERQRLINTTFKGGLQQGFDNVLSQTETIYARLGQDLPAQFKEGMVGAMEAALDKTTSFEDALTGVAVDMLRMIRRASLDYSMSNLTSLIGLGASGGFRQDTFKNFQGYNKGAFVPGSGNGDRVPAMLEPGEYVMNKNAVKAMGRGRLDAINFGAAPRFANGGAMMVNESISSPRMSGFFLASDNPELQEAREEARRKEEERRQKQAEKDSLKNMFLTTLLTAGISKGLGALGNKMQGMMSKGDPMAGAVKPQDLSLSRQVDLDRAIIKAGGENQFAQQQGYPDFKTLMQSGDLLGIDLGRQRGGMIGRGFTNRDSVPAYMAGGEFVMNNKAVKKYGLGFMGRLNGGLIPTMQTGGMVGGAAAAPLSTQSAANTNNISIHVNVGGGGGGQGSTATGNENADQQSNTDKATQGKELSERIRAAVIDVITQEQRIGGSLSKTARQG